MNTATIPKCILVVEDNAEVRSTIAQTLEFEDYTVYTAEDGRQALEQLKQVTPDLILSDINMPHLNGVEFYKQVRKNPRLTSVPFIFLTANDARHEIQAGRELGVEDYLVKPVDLDALLGIINARLLRAAEIKLALTMEAYLDTVKVLAKTIEGRDPYTRGHVERVSMYARWIAQEIGWTHAQIVTLEFGSRLHDVGKIIIPDHILKKTTPLNAEEWKIVEKHPIAGAKIIQGTAHLQDTLPYILYHHEKWNGSGYPCGLSGTDIPVEARLLTIVDVYDALTTDRPYHPARSEEEIISYLHANAGVLFDPHLVTAFIDILLRNRHKQTPHPALHNVQRANV